MIKKLVTLAATALFSLNASAGYIQYDLHLGSNGSGLDGFVIQRDTDQSIAYFSFLLADPVHSFGRYGNYFEPRNDDGHVLLTSATTFFRNNGPTNFTIHSNYGSDNDTDFSVTFARSTGGNFAYKASYRANLWANMPPEVLSGTVFGLARRGEVSQDWVDYLNQPVTSGYYVPYIVPTFIRQNEVPEPTSIALLALGAAGLAGFRRRKVTK